MPAPPRRSTKPSSTSPPTAPPSLIVSQDLDELLAITDRLAVINAGRLSRTLVTADATIDEIGLLMGGLHDLAGEQAGARPWLRLEPRPAPSQAMLWRRRCWPWR